MRELAVAGFIAVAFGLGSFYATDHFGGFNLANLVLGGAALAASLALSARRLRSVGGPHSRRVVIRGLLLIALATGLAVGMERLAERANVRLDWTFEGRYEPADATRKVLSELGAPVQIDLLYDPLDPRIRRTRLLLQTLARLGDVTIREFPLDQVPEEIDEYGVGTSNSLLLRMGSSWQVVGPGTRLRTVSVCQLCAGPSRAPCTPGADSDSKRLRKYSATRAAAFRCWRAKGGRRKEVSFPDSGRHPARC